VDRRAVAGIGTSIVFIAMILTSSAAGSLIMSNMDTASDQATVAVDDTLEMTTNNLEIKSVVGVCDPNTNELTGLEIMVALGPGSNDLNLSSLVIELVLSDVHAVLVHGETGFRSDRVLSVEHSNSTEIITPGDLFMLRFALPHGVGCNDHFRMALLPNNGFATTLSIIVPATLTTTYIRIL
jgi:flagellin-like protein